MDSVEHFADTIDDLLTPIEQAAAACAQGTGDVRAAVSLCRRAADVLNDIGEEEGSSILRLFGMLFEIGEQTMLEEEAGEGPLSQIGAALPTLRECLTGDAERPAESLAALRREATDRWGDHIQLLDYGGAVDDVLSDQSSDEEPDSIGDGDDQIGLILSALQASSGDSDFDVAAESRPETPGPTPARMSIHLPVAAPPSADKELLEAYVEDAAQCLAAMERAVLEYENEPSSAAPVDQICRELHTLKGASASVGLQELTTQLHEVEDAIAAGNTSADSFPLDMVMECIDAVRAEVANLPSQPRPKTSPEAGSGGTASLQADAETLHTDADNSETVRVRTAQLDRLMDLLADVVMWRTRREERLAEFDGIDDELSRCLFRLQALQHRGGSAPAGDQDRSGGTGRKYIAELVSDVREISRNVRQSRQSIADENRAIAQFVQQFRQELVKIRRVPLAGLFQRLHRAVREAARIEGKQVHLEIHGEHFGLERSMQEKLYEPLLHLVRNSVSHGIESPEARVRRRKLPTGTVTLEAYGSSHVLVLEVRDDGGGLDFDAIRRRGLERGLILPDRPVSEAELARLIFRPGFSTKSESNEVSGRGVGMNVVEAVLQSCQCHIETESRQGEGTTFRLTIPLRSVIEHTLLFKCHGQCFGLPMQIIKAASQGGREESQPQQPATVRRHLSQLIGMPTEDTTESYHWIDIADRLAAPSVGHSIARTTHEHQLNLIVDEILGPEEVVVRPLPAMLRNHPHLCGMTLSGTGEVVLLLDGRRLLLNSVGSHSDGSRTPLFSAALPEQHPVMEKSVLVIDDSLSARRSLVKRLRRFGLQITEAADGEQGLELLRNQRFDAIFSDLEMPQLSGFDVLTELASSANDTCPFVIVTTRGEAETRSRAAALGAAGFLAKPVNDRTLDDIVEKLGLMPAATHLEHHS